MKLIQSVQKTFFNSKAQYHFLKIVRDPTKTPEIFKLNEAATKGASPEVVEKIVEGLFQDQGLRRAWEERQWTVIPPLEELQTFPENSFGKKAAEFFLSFDLETDLFPEPDFSTPEKYITARIYQAHDFWHVLTGYSTSLADELALQAFGLGQYKLPLSVSIITGGFMHLLSNQPENVPEVFQKVMLGYQRGMNAQGLLGVPVLERLKNPLEDVQRDLNIVPLKECGSPGERPFRLAKLDFGKGSAETPT